MESFQVVYTQVKQKLGRHLDERETKFLRWIHEQHVSELTKVEKGADQLNGLKEFN